jgi:hypothetical protein
MHVFRKRSRCAPSARVVLPAIICICFILLSTQASQATPYMGVLENGRICRATQFSQDGILTANNEFVGSDFRSNAPGRFALADEHPGR